MKKVVLLLSFVFVLGLISVSAQDKKKEVKKAPKTEQTALKPAEKAKPAKAGEKAPVHKTKKVAPKK
jgi:hypothetical protein